jgi:hypothetical protein
MSMRRSKASLWFPGDRRVGGQTAEEQNRAGGGSTVGEFSAGAQQSRSAVLYACVSLA